MRTGLAAGLAAMLVLPATVILLAVYIFARGAISEEVTSLLEVTLRQKAMCLGQWLNDLEDDIWAFASAPHFTSALASGRQPGTGEAPDRLLATRFTEIRRIYGDRYVEFLVCDTAGTVVFPPGHQPPPVDFRLAVVAGRPVVVNAAADSLCGELALWLCAPIGASGPPWIGVLAARVNPGVLVELFDDPCLGEMGRAYLADVERKTVTLLRNPGDKVSPRLLESEGVRLALAGKTGVRRYRDPGGAEVIGAFTYLPSAKWGLVIEQDAGSAFAGLRRLRTRMVMVLGALALASITFALVAARRIVRHLEQRDRRSAERSEQMITADKLSTVGIMAASVAHEINNPLTTINVLVHNLCEETPPEMPQRMDLNIVLDEIAKIKNIVLRFLEFAGPQEPEFSEVDINQMARRYCQLMRHQTAARGIELSEHVGDDVPPIVADAAQIGQVILNVLLNAIEATPPQGKIELSTACSTRHRRAVCVRIGNTGPELKPEFYEKIFEPFYSTKAQGTGLGLSIARMIVERHGGSITAAGVPGKGTEFVVTLPVQNKAAAHG